MADGLYASSMPMGPSAKTLLSLTAGPCHLALWYSRSCLDIGKQHGCFGVTLHRFASRHTLE